MVNFGLIPRFLLNSATFWVLHWTEHVCFGPISLLLVYTECGGKRGDSKDATKELHTEAK